MNDSTNERIPLWAPLVWGWKARFTEIDHHNNYICIILYFVTSVCIVFLRSSNILVIFLLIYQTSIWTSEWTVSGKGLHLEKKFDSHSGDQKRTKMGSGTRELFQPQEDSRIYPSSKYCRSLQLENWWSVRTGSSSSWMELWGSLLLDVPWESLGRSEPLQLRHCLYCQPSTDHWEYLIEKNKFAQSKDLLISNISSCGI